MVLCLKASFIMSQVCQHHSLMSLDWRHSLCLKSFDHVTWPKSLNVMHPVTKSMSQLSWSMSFILSVGQCPNSLGQCHSGGLSVNVNYPMFQAMPFIRFCCQCHLPSLLSNDNNQVIHPVFNSMSKFSWVLRSMILYLPSLPFLLSIAISQLCNISIVQSR